MIGLPCGEEIATIY